MADSDLVLLDQATTPKQFKPDVIDAGNGVRRTRHSLSDSTGSTINPATVEIVTSVIAKLQEILTDNKLRTIPSGAMTEATGILIKNAILAQNDFEETIFTSTNGSTVYFRRSLFSESNDSITITWTDVDGNQITKPSNIIPLKANTNVDTSIEYFDVINNGTGYSVGNVIARIVVVDLATGIPANTIYYNLNTSTVIAAPVLGDYLLQEQNIKIGASESHLGEIGSSGSHPSATPIATALNYATGKCIGGLNDLTGFLRIAGRGALIQSATLRSKVAQSVEIDLIIFRDTPTITTGLVDGATFNVDPSDIGKVSRVLKFTSWDSVGTACLSTIDAIGKYMTVASGVSAKCILVSKGSVVLTSTSDLVVSLGVIQD